MNPLSFYLDPRILNFSHPSWDSFLVLFYIFAVIIYSFFASRERLTVVLVSIYSALAVTLLTPVFTTYFAGLDVEKQMTYRLGAFLVSFLVLFVLLTRNMALRGDANHAWWQAVILSCMQVGLLISSILYFLPAGRFESSLATYYFTGEIPRTFWMLSPIALMLLLKKRELA